MILARNTIVVLAIMKASLLLPSQSNASEIDQMKPSHAASCSNIELYFMRHLHKQKGADPALNEEGVTTAKAFAEDPRMQDFDVAFSTPYKRTEQTARLVLGNYSRDRSEKLVSYDPRKPSELVQEVMMNYCNQKVLIVGHSNTTPQLVQQFGGQFAVSFGGVALELQPSLSLSESDYGKVFHINYSNSVVSQSLITLDKQ